MPSDISQAIEQDQIASTLLGDVSDAQRYDEGQNAGTEYRPADGEDGVDYSVDQPSDEVEEVAPEATEDAPQATPEQREAFTQEMQQWAALPAEQQAQRADESLQDAYGEAYETITPQEATTFTNVFGKTHWGIDNLAERIEPQAFAPFAEVWSDNAARTISLHPHAEQFLEAIGDEQRQAEALQLAHSMCDNTMAQRFYTHFERMLGNELLQGYTPLSFAAKCLCDYARMENLGQERQEPSAPQRKQQFQTNRDIFSDDVLDHFRTL